MGAKPDESGETGFGNRCCRVSLRLGKVWSCDLLDRPAKPTPAGASLALKKALSQVDQYLKGKRRSFDVELDLQGPPFTLRVWKALQKNAPYGKTLSYGALAALAGNPMAARAVGSAMRRNPVPLFIPCHRVIGHGGALGGFSCGLGWKRFLLALEGHPVQKDPQHEA